MRASGLVADVALLAWILATPLSGGLTEERHIEYVGLACINQTCLGFAQLWRDEVSLNSVGVDSVVDLREVAADIPAESLTLSFFEPLKLLDEVQLELNRDPRGKFVSDIRVGVRAAVTTSFRLNTNGPRTLNPLLGRQCETVETSLLSNPVEFDGIKPLVIDLLPDTEELNGIAVPQPVPDEVVAASVVRPMPGTL